MITSDLQLMQALPQQGNYNCNALIIHVFVQAVLQLTWTSCCLQTVAGP